MVLLISLMGLMKSKPNFIKGSVGKVIINVAMFMVAKFLVC